MSNHIHIERRIEKRIYLNYTCSFTLIIDDGLLPFNVIELIDVSKDGLAFTLESVYGSFKEGDLLSARLYLNNFKSDTIKYFLPMTLSVHNFTDLITNTGAKVRYGCSIICETPEYQKMIEYYVNFLNTASRFVKEDKGDYFISNTVA